MSTSVVEQCYKRKPSVYFLYFQMQNLKLYWFLHKEFFKGLVTGLIATQASSILLWAFYKYIDGTIFGACCLATKINETKLQFLGYSNFRIRLIAFVIANTSTALAGSLYAVYLGSVSPEITSPARTADPVVVTILGGVGSLFGPLIGTIVYTGLRDVVSKLIGTWEFFIGLILVLIMLTNSGGLYGSAESIVKKWFKKSKSPIQNKEMN